MRVEFNPPRQAGAVEVAAVIVLWFGIDGAQVVDPHDAVRAEVVGVTPDGEAVRVAALP